MAAKSTSKDLTGKGQTAISLSASPRMADDLLFQLAQSLNHIAGAVLLADP